MVLAMTLVGGMSSLQPLGAVLSAQTIAPPVSADTEILTVGHSDFTRYDTPGWCQAAGGWTANVLRGTLEAAAVLDTVRPWQDTVGVMGVAAVTRTCGARFTAANTDAALLPNLFDLALQEHADSLAAAAVARFAQSHRDIQWTQVVRGYLEGRPPRLAAAEALVAQLDAHESLAPLAQRVQAHGQLLAMWAARGDSARSRSEAEQLIRLGQTLPDTTRARFLRSGEPLWHAYTVLTTLAFLAHPAVSGDSAIHARYVAAGGRDPLAPSAAFGDPVQGRWEQLDPINRWSHNGGDWKRAQQFTPFPIWHATYWFPASAAQQSPVPGKVNLYVILGGRWRGQGMLAVRLRRWLARYQSQNLAVTIVARTYGFAQFLQFDQQPFGPWTPSEEARALAEYVQQYEQLPVTVAVTETPMQWRPPPDGRRVIEDTARFAGNDIVSDLSPLCVLIGRDGKFLDQERMEETINPTFEALLGWAVAQPQAAPH